MKDSRKWICPRSLGGESPQDPHSWTESGTCIFCHSISPELFMEKVRNSEELTPTDTSYKVLIGKDKKLFYFQHLTAPQKHEFVGLFNAKRLSFGLTEKFFIVPYFMHMVK